MSTSSDEAIRVVDNPAAERYEAWAGAELAGFADYRVRSIGIIFVHTEVAPAFEGRSVGSSIARFALDDARARGLAVVPRCPFFAAYIRRHPEYADLVRGS